MWQRFTERARKVVYHAQEEAVKLGQHYVAPEHLLLGITRVPDSVGAKMLEQLGMTLAAIRADTEARTSFGNGNTNRDMQLTPRAKRVIDLAYDEARQLNHNYIGVEHILLGLRREGESLAAKVLEEFGITLKMLQDQLQLLTDSGEVLDEAAKPRTTLEAFAVTLSGLMGAGDDKHPEETRRQEELLSLDEAVKFLGTSKPTLYRLLGQDEIKGLKVGRQWRFRKADLIAYMERSPVAVSAAPKEDLDMELAFFDEQLSKEEPNAPSDPETKTIRLAHEIIHLAINSKASDIHLEPNANDFLLRYRADGVLQEIRRLPTSTRESLTACYKTMAEIDSNEKRLPQDGRIAVKHEDKDFDLRVAVMPSTYGEAITMRILAKQDILLGLDTLGLVPEDLRQMRDLMQQPNGIVIVTGPTGSGKTTLLYSCLQEVAAIEKKTVTIEDPVEFVLPYTTQTQVSKKVGLTFAAAVRVFLRQDPDIILVGEMRDLEVANLTAEAALTGHLALTALHTDNAPSALLRLLNMGVEPYLISATVRGVVATRLLRRVCENCKQPQDLSADPTLSYIAQLAAEGGYEIPANAVFVRGAGCEQCRGRGYRSRMGLYEVLTLTEPLTEAILRRAPIEELTDLAVAGGMRTLLADGIRKAAEGLTTVDEVMRVVSVTI